MRWPITSRAGRIRHVQSQSLIWRLAATVQIAACDVISLIPPGRWPAAGPDSGDWCMVPPSSLLRTHKSGEFQNVPPQRPVDSEMACREDLLAAVHAVACTPERRG